MNENDNKSILFQKTESDVYKESLWDRMHLSTNFGNVFVDNADSCFADVEDKENKEATPRLEIQFLKPDMKSLINKNSSTARVGNITPRPQHGSPNRESQLLTEKINRKSTMDVSDEEKSVESSNSEDYVPSSLNKKRRKKRRDVIFKQILREWRRYFQIQLQNYTGFISSKKARTDDYMYKCMEKFNIECLGKAGTFEDNFYLASLLYPQDLVRSIDCFLVSKDSEDLENLRRTYRKSAQRIHDTLYKYSNDKLEYFVSKPEIWFLFCNFYENGAGPDKENPKFVEEYEFIRSKCMDTLNKI